VHSDLRTAAPAVNLVSLPPNGSSLTGINQLSLPPNGISLNGLNPTGLSAGGQPIGVSLTGAPWIGNLTGSTWTGQLSDGSMLALRIDAAQQGTGANADVWSYNVAAQAGGVWRALCLDQAGNPSFADSVSGTWNIAQSVPGGGAYHPENSHFTLACKGSSIAKCVELGYKPWLGHDATLAACVRALRADYCGDGTPYTVDGTIINIYDIEGVVADGAPWVAEAAWTVDGASCVSKKKQTRFDQVASERPWCYPHALKAKKSCGTEFAGDEVIITELTPQ
jgi:ADYC domain